MLDIDRLAAVNLRLHDHDATDPNQPGQRHREQFSRQLATVIRAKDDGLIAGIGLSNIAREHLLFALDHTEIVCVQSAFNLVDRSSQPVLGECTARGIAFVPFFPLGSSGCYPDRSSAARTMLSQSRPCHR
jgi:pyridoxine 4-dehydrogenase